MDCKSTSTKEHDTCGDCGNTHAKHHEPGFDGRHRDGSLTYGACATKGFRPWDDYTGKRCEIVGPLPAPPDFEAHIIFEGKHHEKAKAVATLAGWKFSKIDGDPYLGDGVRCYLTTHSQDRVALEARMRQVVDACKLWDLPALRMKIEQIVLDVRF